MNTALSIVYYRKGLAEVREKEPDKAFDDFCNAFLQRLTGVDLTLEFVTFYRYQLQAYLKAKPVFTLSLPEGDMISELIADTYRTFLDDIDSSPFNVTGSGRKNLLFDIDIVFPWQKDTDGRDKVL